MIKFFLILFIIMSMVIALTRFCLKYWLPKEKLSIWSRRLFILNIISIFAMPLGYSIFKDIAFIKFALLIVTIFFMLQLTFDIFMLISLSIRFLYRKLFQQFSNDDVDEQRRMILKGAAILPLTALATTLYASFFERCNTVVNNLKIHIKNLPASFHGFTIAQISDIHLGPYMDLDDLRKLLEKTTTLKADVLVITGDLFDNEKMNFKAAKIVNEYVDKFPQGIYYCYGNHEYIRGIAGIEIALSNTDIKVLKNNNQAIDIKGEKIYLAGVDYPMDRERFSELQELYTELALKNIPQNSPIVMLAHHPDFFESAAPRGVGLTLAGHTHGGQIGLFGIPIVPPVFKYMRGLYEINGKYCYVHVGNGSWFPYRFGCPPEIAIFTLV